MRRLPLFPLALGLTALLALAGCRRSDAATAGHVAGDSGPRPARIDSILPPAEALRRFQASIADTPAALRGGESSLPALGAAFARAVERRDTAALRALVVNRGEYAFLLYPGSDVSHRPRYQPPEIAWLRLQLASEKGVGRLVERLGGRPLGYVGLTCPDSAVVAAGPVRLHPGCRVRRLVGRDTVAQRLFGTVLERDGRFKLLTYANDF
ncbi:MAG TPA: hypothetical protein VFS40_07605 [Gemmatimonadales bacterium]|nr:hypothetical protein [Gemmatimonadales bacterium]